MDSRHLTSILVDQIDSVEFSYFRDRTRIMQEVSTDMEDVQFTKTHQFRTMMVPNISSPFLNKILVAGPPDLALLTSSLEAFAVCSKDPTIEISPGAINVEVARLLFKKGFAQTNLYPIFILPLSDLQTTEPLLQTRLASTAKDLEDFQNMFVSGWKIPDMSSIKTKASIAKWMGHPNWHLYVAYEKGQPISCAVLYRKDEFGFLLDAITPESFRGRGGQSALLLKRILDAKKIGIKQIFTHTEFGSISQKNMEKIGMRPSYFRSTWTKIDS